MVEVIGNLSGHEGDLGASKRYMGWGVFLNFGTFHSLIFTALMLTKTSLTATPSHQIN
jgi:hypothetical protein